MADAKISALTNLTAADPINDMIPIVDVSDTPPASGNTKRISINNILSSSPTASGALTVTGLVTAGSATITGALGAAGLNVTGATIPANGIYLGSANNLSFSAASALRMTLNSTGLNAAGKLAINGASLTYDLNVRASTSNLGSTVFVFEQSNGTSIMQIRDNGTVIFAGDIRLGNTVNTVSPTSPNRTITMVVNGVTLYIPAKTTND